MQLITAIVAPSRVYPVLRAMRLFGVTGWTLSSVYLADASLHARIDVVTANTDVADVVHVISRASGTVTGLWVLPVDLVVRISTGERGPAAVS